MVDGKYEVRAVLGEGGMGTVYEAEHAAIGRIVAMKVLHPAQATKKVAVKRFQQEARAVGAIGHPNICEIFDFGTLSDGGPYLIMERLKGATLAERIEAEGALPVDHVLDAVTQILSALDAAHARGILHRDIKPENVFLVERAGLPPVAKLLDFGVSKVVSARVTDEEDVGDLTKTGLVMGTPYYMSPEQARGERDLDVRVDIYACGVLLYQALTGQRPFFAQNYNLLLALILEGEPKPPRELRPSIPAELERVILKAMAKERDDRYRSASELSRALTSTRKDRPTPSASRMRARLPARTPEIPIHVDATHAPIGTADPDTEENEVVAPKPRRKDEADVPTNRMHQDQIKALTDAIREARDREKRKPR